jgi:hydrogenase maturation factor HypF (carbamoyltransferase family)
MPHKQKINLEKVLASLNTVCPKCRCSIAPARIRRVSFDEIVCPECGARFKPSGE